MSKGGKSVSFKVPGPKLSPAADVWIANRTVEPSSDREGGNVTPIKPAEPAATPEPPAVPEAVAPKEKMARFTFDVSEALHRRMKMQCAARGLKMTDVVRDLLEREFPKT